MRFDSIVFDLDGTLWDTSHACAVAWNTVLARRGIEFREITAEDVRKVTGRPHDECIQVTFAGLPDEQIQVLIEDTAIEDNVTIDRIGGPLYEAVEEGLRELSRHVPLFIVSNCQTGYIEMFLQKSGLGDVFTDIECFGNTRQHKGENVRRVIERNGLKNPLMVGDAVGDEDAARFCGIPFAYATYGFGEGRSPEFRLATFRDLLPAVGLFPAE